jgi:hypothetical protein
MGRELETCVFPPVPTVSRTEKKPSQAETNEGSKENDSARNAIDRVRI